MPYAARILVPTDFSPLSTLALEHAIALASLCRASIHLMHVEADVVRDIDDEEQRLAGLVSRCHAETIFVTSQVCGGQADCRHREGSGRPRRRSHRSRHARPAWRRAPDARKRGRTGRAHRAVSGTHGAGPGPGTRAAAGGSGMGTLTGIAPPPSLTLRPAATRESRLQSRGLRVRQRRHDLRLRAPQD